MPPRTNKLHLKLRLITGINIVTMTITIMSKKEVMW